MADAEQRVIHCPKCGATILVPVLAEAGPKQDRVRITDAGYLNVFHPKCKRRRQK